MPVQPEGALDGVVDREFEGTSFIANSNRPDGRELQDRFFTSVRSLVREREEGPVVLAERRREITLGSDSGREIIAREETGNARANDPLRYVFSFTEPVAFGLDASFGNSEEGFSSVELVGFDDDADPATFASVEGAETVVRRVEGTPNDNLFSFIEVFGERFLAVSNGSPLDPDELDEAVAAIDEIDDLDLLGDGGSFDNPDLDRPGVNGTLTPGTYGIFVENRPLTDGGFGSAAETASFRFTASTLGGGGDDGPADGGGEPAVVPTPTAAAAGLLGLLTIARRRRRY